MQRYANGSKKQGKIYIDMRQNHLELSAVG